jgi:signal recognition particle subunit SRP54
MKQHRQMADMMKKVSRGGLGSLGGMFGGKMPAGMPGMGAGGMPDLSGMDPAQLERMAREAGIDPKMLQQAAGSGDGAAAPQKTLSEKLPSDVGKLLNSGPGLPGLGGPARFPGLPGLGGGFVPKKK